MTSFKKQSVALVAVLCAVLFLSSCRVDQTISLEVNRNGTGTVTVTAIANKAILDAAPELAADIRTDDLVTAGWKVDGPTPTDDGGLRIEISRDFKDPTEATLILGQVNGPRGPLQEAVLTRSGKDTNSLWTLAGRLEVNGGLQAFIDDAAFELLGSAPYAADIEEAGLDLGAAVGLNFTVSMPGEIESTTGVQNNGTVSWLVPMDGSRVDIATSSTNVDVVSSVAGVGRVLLLAILVLWIAGMAVLLLLVLNAKQRRTRTPRI
ncbi:MAG: hypothetical protein F2545_05515 [Actinobacteria bacterium]|nr:hypothetical protein [Actinomycetota bacterium]